RVLEFYASIEGDVVLANVKGGKVGSKGRPVPGTAKVELVAYDPATATIRTDGNGYALRCADNEVGLLISKASDAVELSAGGLRGVFAPGDAWMPTENLFRRDSDGDYWLVDRTDTVVTTERGPVYGQPIVDVLNDIAAVDMEVAYGLEAAGRTLSVAAVCVREGWHLEPKDVTEAMRALDPSRRPDLVYVVDTIPRSAAYRPSTSAVRAAGRPRPGPDTWCYHPDTESYEVLTEAEAAELFGTRTAEA